jgi:translation initiation factor IF-2
MLTGALPSQPVRIVGFGSLPKAGDPIVSVGSEEIGRSIVDRRKAAMSIAGSEEGNEYATSFRAEGGPERDLQVVGIESKDGIMMTKLLGKYDLLDNKAGASDNTKIRIPVILIADANGTLDAVREALISVGSSSKLDLVIDPVSLSTGPITTSNVRMAIDSGAAIFAFNLKGSSDAAAMSLAEKEGVEIRSHNVIYRLLDDAKEVFAKSLPPVKQDKVHGRALVQATFDVTGNKADVRIAGLRVQEGYLYKTKSKASSGEKPLECYYRVLRNGTVVSPEKKKITAASLRKVKEDVEDVRRGEECGLGLEGYSDIQAGDIIECYSTEMKSVFM